MKYNDNLHIAETLVDQRKKAGKSQNDLAQYCGVSTSSVSKWERATTRYVINLLNIFNLISFW